MHNFTISFPWSDVRLLPQCITWFCSYLTQFSHINSWISFSSFSMIDIYRKEVFFSSPLSKGFCPPLLLPYLHACLICFNLIFLCFAVQCLRFYFSTKDNGKVKPKTMESNQQHIFARCTIAELVALSPCSKKVLSSNPEFQSFCMKFAWSFSLCMYGFLLNFPTSSHSPKASLLG